MKKLLLLFLIVFSFFTVLSAKQVDEATARKVAGNFLKNLNSGNPALAKTGQLELAYTFSAKDVGGQTSFSKKQEVYFYVFNLTVSKGFVIVSGDDNLLPVLAYSYENNFDPENIPDNAAKWLENYKSEIKHILENKAPATKEITQKWTRLKEGKPISGALHKQSAVAPLVKSKWNQAPFYNDLCPYDAQQGKRAVTGCVATSMAMIMKYWNYPLVGIGASTYNHYLYGKQSADYSKTAYNWSAMPDRLTGPNEAVARLMYHCGVAVEMNYGVNASGAYVSHASPSAYKAFRDYFGYEIDSEYRDFMDDMEWAELLKNEMNEKRPVLYAGFSNSAGHAFVCDGYDENDFFHFNWGWGGAYDGYFILQDLNPSGTGIGGGNGGGYNYNQHVLLGIQPQGKSTSQEIRLTNNVTLTPGDIRYKESFTVSANIENTGNTYFYGELSAAVFDNDNNLISFIDTRQLTGLAPGPANEKSLVFTSGGLANMTPGSYKISIFYRQNNGSWQPVADNGNFINQGQMAVSNPNTIELSSAISTIPNAGILKGKPATFIVNVHNKGTDAFTGKYQLALYNTEGKLVQMIAEIEEKDGLAAGASYSSPFLRFQAATIMADPGNYTLFVFHQPSGGEWELTGSSNFSNPVKITVNVPENLLADPYEINNSLSAAYSILPNFIGNQVTTRTINSNLHRSTDEDYYKLNLKEGFTYKISPRLHDAKNTGNGNYYSVDAGFRYSLDGISWSAIIDDEFTGEIESPSGFVYFHVTPSTPGATGTYLLDFTVSRTKTSNTTGINREGAENDFISVYPNPATSRLIIDPGKSSNKINLVNLINISGQKVISFANSNQQDVIDLSLGNLPAGMYFVEMHTATGVFSKKIVVEK